MFCPFCYFLHNYYSILPFYIPLHHIVLLLLTFFLCTCYLVMFHLTHTDRGGRGKTNFTRAVRFNIKYWVTTGPKICIKTKWNHSSKDGPKAKAVLAPTSGASCGDVELVQGVGHTKATWDPEKILPRFRWLRVTDKARVLQSLLKFKFTQPKYIVLSS